eukprot:Sdes_comp20609_c0_seq1m15637
MVFNSGRKFLFDCSSKFLPFFSEWKRNAPGLHVPQKALRFYSQYSRKIQAPNEFAYYSVLGAHSHISREDIQDCFSQNSNYTVCQCIHLKEPAPLPYPLPSDKAATNRYYSMSRINPMLENLWVVKLQHRTAPSQTSQNQEEAENLSLGLVDQETRSVENSNSSSENFPSHFCPLDNIIGGCRVTIYPISFREYQHVLKKTRFGPSLQKASAVEIIPYQIQTSSSRNEYFYDFPWENTTPKLAELWEPFGVDQEAMARLQPPPNIVIFKHERDAVRFIREYQNTQIFQSSLSKEPFSLRIYLTN